MNLFTMDLSMLPTNALLFSDFFFFMLFMTSSQEDYLDKRNLEVPIEN